MARRPVGPKDREYVKSITYKALARVDVEFGVMSWPNRPDFIPRWLVGEWVMQTQLRMSPDSGIWSRDQAS